MLPNLKIMIGAVMFAVILFAVTGAGVFMPGTYTRIGEMPEIGRPMMQRMIADEPAQAQFHILTLTRRSEELDRLRERAALEVAPLLALASPEPDAPKPAVIESPDPGTIVAAAAVAPVLQLSGAMGTVQGTGSEMVPGSVEMRPATTPPDGAPDATLPEAPDAAPPAAAADPNPVQVAALPTAADAKPPEPAPSPHAKVPRLRPAAKAPPKRSVHRAHRLARVQANTLGQGMFGQPFQSR